MFLVDVSYYCEFSCSDSAVVDALPLLDILGLTKITQTMPEMYMMFAVVCSPITVLLILGNNCYNLLVFYH